MAFFQQVLSSVARVFADLVGVIPVGEYNASAPTLTDGQGVPLQQASDGSLLTTTTISGGLSSIATSAKQDTQTTALGTIHTDLSTVHTDLGTLHTDLTGGTALTLGTIYNATTPTKTSLDKGYLDVTRRGTLFLCPRHWRKLSLPATSSTSLPEGPCDCLRVDTYGAIVYAQPPERAAMCVDGTFPSGTNWTLGTGWAVANNLATHTAGNTADLSQNTATANANDPIIANETYVVIYTVSGRSAGTITAKLGTTAGTTRSADGTYVEAITAQAATLNFTPDTNFNGSISNVWIIPGTMPLSSNTWEWYSAIKIVGVATSAAPATLSTSIKVQAGWLRRAGATELT